MFYPLKWFDICTKYKKLTNKIQTLEKPTNDTKKKSHTYRGILDQNLPHCGLLKLLKKSGPRLLENEHWFIQWTDKNDHQLRL